MKYRCSHWCCKLLAWLLAGVCLVFGFWSAYISLTCASFGMYGDKTAYQETFLCRERLDAPIADVIVQYRRDPDFKDWGKLLKNNQMRFIILEEDTGKVTASYVEGLNIRVPQSLKNNIYLLETNHVLERGAPGSIFENVYVCDYYFNDEWMGDRSLDYAGESLVVYDSVEEPVAVFSEPIDTSAGGTMHQMLFFLPLGMEVNDTTVGRGFELYRMWNYWKHDALVILALCAVGLLTAGIFLCLQAGRRPGVEEVRTTWLDRIWLELIVLVGFLAAVGCFGLFFCVYDTYYNRSITWTELQMIIVLCDVGAVACGLAVIGCLLSVVTRLKSKTLLRSSLSFRILAWCWKWLKKPLCWIGNTVRCAAYSLSIVPLTVLVIFGVLVMDVLLLTWMVNSWDPAGVIALIILFNGIVIAAVIWSVAQMKKLQQAAKALADGDLEHHLDTKGMYWHFKKHGEDLNAIAGGMTKAVAQKMRSENLKTELITNVSHDIKTPLTSIVNYVDLLQKPHTEAEGVQYLEVLQRQAQRLKKLTEDLVEASKASTGNIPVELETLNVMELINQAVEEYRERLEEQKLEIVTSVRGDLAVLADGRLLWRVLDNLLSNVVKYALTGTRVYVTAVKKNKEIVLAVKNISRDSLDLDTADLMDRFVRGDSSRHTEGSGLGLNIAGSLVRLQNGMFELTVDGDLFKATITLPEA